jgi:hypothetical protein
MLKKEKGEKKMKKTKLLSVTVLIVFLLSLFAVFPNVYAAGTIYLTPSDNIYDTDTAYVGKKFNVTVSCSGVDQDIAGAQITLHFDDSILNVTQWWAPYWDSSFFMPSPYSALPTPPDPGYVHVGAGHGYIKVSVLKGGLPPTAPWGHNGTIAIIEFNITKLPDKLGELSCTLGINNIDTYLKNPSVENIPVTIQDGSYTISWKKPGPAHMGVKPTLKEYGPYPPSAVGQYFNIGVYIENLSEAWYLTSASFKLTYNATVIDVLGGESNVTFDGNWGNHSITFTVNPDPAVLDYMDINVSDPTTTPKDDALVATITFTVMMQSNTPPYPVGYYDGSPLDFSDVVLMDHVGPVDTSAPSNGQVKIYALMTLPMALFKVQPKDTVLGPEPSVGKEFDVDVVIGGPTSEGLSFAWYLIGVQFRLFYDASLLDVVSITEGPFLKDPAWNIHGTFFVGTVESDGLGPHVMVGEMLLPNPSNGIYDQTSWPNGTGSVVTIRFKAIKQNLAPCYYEEDYLQCELGLKPLFPGCWALDRTGSWIPIDEASNVNGTYRIYDTFSTGRMIDLYGGAWNAGYGTYPFPAPYGGQGPNNPMDLVIPQSEIKLFAKVEYNCWPVQSKDVGFEIEGPYDKLPNGTLVKRQGKWQIWGKFTARTDSAGIAILVYRMPWPCVDPESITGIWKVTATVNLADVVINDTMAYYYEHMVYITKVTTDYYYYAHDEDINVKVEYGSHSMQKYDALFAIVVTDELGVPFNMTLKTGVKVGSGKYNWCTFTSGDFTGTIIIPKYAFAGLGYVHVSVYDKDPTNGGFAWGPEYTPLPEIYILPIDLPTVYITPSSVTWNQTEGIPITFTAVASGGFTPYTYQWYTDGYMQPGATSSTFTVYSWSPGTHTITVKVTDAHGNVAYGTATINVII